MKKKSNIRKKLNSLKSILPKSKPKPEKIERPGFHWPTGFVISGFLTTVGVISFSIFLIIIIAAKIIGIH